MDNFTYYREGLKTLASIKESGKKPTLLLHSCCAPCNAFPMVYLLEYFDLTLYFNNSNIYPEAEYQRRLAELEKYRDFVNQKYHTNIKMIVTPYEEPKYREKLAILGSQKEGQGRCRYCYAKRMNEAYRYANEHHFDYFTTVMTISRQKSSQILNMIGNKLEPKYPNTKYLYSDFKKGQGIDKGLVIAKEHNMYRQEYCGCFFSKQAYDKKTSGQ